MLSLMQIGNVVEPDKQTIIDLYITFITNGWIDAECTILNGPAILRYLTGDKWLVQKIEKPITPCPPGDRIIYQYHAFSGEGYHFKTAEVDTEVERERILAGYRIYTRAV
jgi:hypothetical protein